MTRARSNATANAAKGNIVVGSGTDVSNALSIGTDGQVFTADSTTATGTKWATASGLPAQNTGTAINTSGWFLDGNVNYFRTLNNLVLFGNGVTSPGDFSNLTAIPNGSPMTWTKGATVVTFIKNGTPTFDYSFGRINMAVLSLSTSSYTSSSGAYVLTDAGTTNKWIQSNGTAASWQYLPDTTATRLVRGTIFGFSDSTNTILGASSTAGTYSGGQNTGLGDRALQNLSTGSTNTGIGAYSLLSLIDGSSNVGVGQSSGYSITSGQYNTNIGAYANDGTYGVGTSTGNNNTVIGFDSHPTTSTVSNQITLGNSTISGLRCQVTSISGLSDARDKTNIEPIALGVDFINTLNPVKFDWNMRQPEQPKLDNEGNPIIEGKVGVPDVGFIAQDLIAAEDATGLADYLQLTLRDNPDKLEATQGRLIPILVKAIQELSAEIEALKAAK